MTAEISKQTGHCREHQKAETQSRTGKARDSRSSGDLPVLINLGRSKKSGYQILLCLSEQNRGGLQKAGRKFNENVQLIFKTNVDIHNGSWHMRCVMLIKKKKSELTVETKYQGDSGCSRGERQAVQHGCRQMTGVAQGSSIYQWIARRQKKRRMRRL